MENERELEAEVKRKEKEFLNRKLDIDAILRDAKLTHPAVLAAYEETGRRVASGEIVEIERSESEESEESE